MTVKDQASQAAGAKVAPVPAPHGATPYLVIKGASDAIAFYQRVFGADVVVRLDGPGGGVMHAELQVGPARFMLTEECPQYGSLGPASLGGSGSSASLYFNDVDAVLERALKAGCKVTMPLDNHFWGDRAVGIADPFGHKWTLCTRIEEPSAEEIQRRAKELFSKETR